MLLKVKILQQHFDWAASNLDRAALFSLTRLLERL